MVQPYIPDRGDIVWLNCTPQSGHEQMGNRPAIALSPKQYNSKTDLALFCPITSNKKGYPFEVVLPEKLKISGVILSDQIKSLDWKARTAQFVDRVPESVTKECSLKLKTLLIIN